VRAVAFWALVALCLAACSKRKASPADEGVVATVDGEVLSRVELERELARELPSIETTAAAQDAEQLGPFKQALLQTMIERTLLLRAAKEANVVVSAEEVDREVMRISADYSADGFNEILAQGQLSLAELKQKTGVLLTIQKLFLEHVYPRVAVTEEEIHTYYDQHLRDFEEPEQVHAAQIVVKGIDDARRVQVQLRAGKKFADLARKYSLSPDARLGGDLGFFPRGVMPPQFDEVVFKLGVNQVSDVVSTDYGFHLFKVLDRKPARKRELHKVRYQVEQRLLTQKRQEAQQEYVNALKRKAVIKINEATMSAIKAKASASSSRIAEP
jgi:peptidyl-prolyl cis-trans isomerase C/foldase protein PrsA